MLDDWSVCLSFDSISFTHIKYFREGSWVPRRSNSNHYVTDSIKSPIACEDRVHVATNPEASTESSSME